MLQLVKKNCHIKTVFHFFLCDSSLPWSCLFRNESMSGNGWSNFQKTNECKTGLTLQEIVVLISYINTCPSCLISTSSFEPVWYIKNKQTKNNNKNKTKKKLPKLYSEGTGEGTGVYWAVFTYWHSLLTVSFQVRLQQLEHDSSDFSCLDTAAHKHLRYWSIVADLSHSYLTKTSVVKCR